jgi:hypothetical protein
MVTPLVIKLCRNYGYMSQSSATPRNPDGFAQSRRAGLILFRTNIVPCTWYDIATGIIPSAEGFGNVQNSNCV